MRDYRFELEKSNLRSAKAALKVYESIDVDLCEAFLVHYLLRCKEVHILAFTQ